MDNRARNSFYGNNYTPHFMCDGDKSPGYAIGSYATYVTNRMAVASPLGMELLRNYNQASGQGQVCARIHNETGGTISGKLHFVLTETGMQYSAPNGQMLHNHVVRGMFPFSFGRQIEIDAGGTFRQTEDFQIETSKLNPDSCEIVCFVQATNKEIYQGVKVSAWTDHGLAYDSRAVSDPTGNGNGLLDAGEDAEIIVTLKNTGAANCQNVTATLACDDPYVAVLDSTGSFGTVNKGATGNNDADRFKVRVAGNAPNAHAVTFDLFVCDEDRYFAAPTFTDSTHAPVGPVAEASKVLPRTAGLFLVGRNPAAARVQLTAELPRTGDAELVIVDGQGRLVSTLCSGQLSAGRHPFTWNCRADGTVPGVYFAVLKTEASQTARAKVVVLP